MPKALNIKKISAASVEAAEICRIMDEAHIEFVQVDNHCWAADFPYKPKFEVRMAHNGSQLLINYRVTEECVRAVAPHDDGNVWEDSCCELFLSPVADGTYYNMECNAAGTMLIGFGPSREGRERAQQDVLDKVKVNLCFWTVELTLNCPVLTVVGTANEVDTSVLTASSKLVFIRKVRPEPNVSQKALVGRFSQKVGLHEPFKLVSLVSF